MKSHWTRIVRSSELDNLAEQLVYQKLCNILYISLLQRSYHFNIPARWSEIILQQYACRLGIDHTTIYLERFFRNLLSGDKWDLRNRYLYVNASEEWKVPPVTSACYIPIPLDLHVRNTC